MKIIMLHHLSGNESFDAGNTYEFDNAEALRLIDAGIAKPKDKKEYDQILAKVEKELEEKEENERKAAAILRKHDLEKERMTLQNKIDAITHILDDAKTYYLPYAGLVDDLLKQEAKNVNESNENKKDDLPQGEGK